MRKLLIPLLAALALPVHAGIPESLDGRWAIANETPKGTWLIDTEDVEVKGPVLRFWVERRQGKEERPDPNVMSNWSGKYRINCKKFTARQEIPDGPFGRTRIQPYSKMKPGWFAYSLANNFCFLTGVEGYTPEPNPAPWAEKIIKTVQSQPIKKSLSRINCDSPVWKNKPRCN